MISVSLLNRQLSNLLRAGACLKKNPQNPPQSLVILVGASGAHCPLLSDQSPELPVERRQENCLPLEWKEAVTAAAPDAMCLYTSSLATLFHQEREITVSHSVS